MAIVEKKPLRPSDGQAAFRGVLRTKYNICNGVFSRKYETNFSH